MTAAIYIDPAAIHPVVEGEWHRTRLTGIPKSGQGITMLCGVNAAAEFLPCEKRRDHSIPTQCSRCDAIYRQENGIPQQHTRQSR